MVDLRVLITPPSPASCDPARIRNKNGGGLIVPMFILLNYSTIHRWNNTLLKFYIQESDIDSLCPSRHPVQSGYWTIVSVPMKIGHATSLVDRLILGPIFWLLESGLFSVILFGCLCHLDIQSSCFLTRSSSWNGSGWIFIFNQLWTRNLILSRFGPISRRRRNQCNFGVFFVVFDPDLRRFPFIPK